MSNLLFIVPIFMYVVCPTPTTPFESGFFTIYNQAPTDGTISYHQTVSGKLPLDMSPYRGVVAYVEDCSKVGSEAWIRLTDPRMTFEFWNVWVPVMIFDCGGDQESIENFFRPNGIIGELGFYIASDSGAYDLHRGVAGDLSWSKPPACVTPTPIFTPTASPTIATNTPVPTTTVVLVPPIATLSVISMITRQPILAKPTPKLLAAIWSEPIFPLRVALLWVGGLTTMILTGLLLLNNVIARIRR